MWLKRFLGPEASEGDNTSRFKNMTQSSFRNTRGDPKTAGRETLMRRYAAMHFANCPEGGQGRKRNLGDVEALIKSGCRTAERSRRTIQKRPPTA